MTPVVDGAVHHFEHGGLYNGLFLMRDRESGSYWDHITGDCVYGPLREKALPVDVLHLMTAAQTAEAHEYAQIALSAMPWWRRVLTRFQRLRTHPDARGILPPFFRLTMGEEDARRPRMEIGLGVWSEKSRRFYPRDVVSASGFVRDRLDGRSLVVYNQPETQTPAAVFLEAKPTGVHEETLHLKDGSAIRNGYLYAMSGDKEPLERPQQLLTRWYGFAYTFPDCEIYEGDG